MPPDATPESRRTTDRELVRRAIATDLFGEGEDPGVREDPNFEEDAGAKATVGAQHPRVAPPAELRVPDKYQLLEPIGAGGFGYVYRAHDSTLDRDVAIKFLTDARPADVERFRREARFTARLQDPNIVHVYEFGGEDAVPFIAMQYVRGTHLGECDLELEPLLTVLREIARALGRAHLEGIVHRDLKPENVLIDEGGKPYLTDFGIARDLFGAPDRELSFEGVIVGTPAMMSPEQARGESHAVDARTDIYSFGATLYYLLTGRPPFSGDSTVDVLHAVIHREPPLPRSIRPQIPRAVESIIMRCLHKEKSARYARMDEIVSALDAAIQGEEPAREGATWFRRLVGATPSPSPPNTDDQPEWRTALEISNELSRWSVNLYRVSGDLTPAYQKLDRLVARLDAVLAEHPDWAWARLYRGMALRRRGRLEEARDEIERAIDRVRERDEAFFELGRVYLALYLRRHREALKHLTKTGVDDRMQDARRLLTQAVHAFEQCEICSSDRPPWHTEFADAVARLAEQDYAGCVAKCEAILADDPDLEEVWKLHGDALRLDPDRHDVDPVTSYDRAVEIRRSYLEAHFARAELLAERSDYAEARDALDRAVTIAPDWAEAVALRSRVDLREIRALESSPDESASAIRERLRSAVETAQDACERFPTSYDLRVSLIELQIANGRAEGDTTPLEGALRTIEVTRTLAGCMNRVNLLHATTLLARARIRRANGDPARDDLETILRYPEVMPMAPVGSPQWQAVLEAARALADDDDSSAKA